MFQSPKTGLYYFHYQERYSFGRVRLCFNPLKRVYTIFTKNLWTSRYRRHKRLFQSPKTGLYYFHAIEAKKLSTPILSFNPLKRVYTIFTIESSDNENELTIKCFNPLKRVYTIFTSSKFSSRTYIWSLFQSPKTGLYYFHIR